MTSKSNHTPWLDCHAKVTNRELRALYRGPFANTVQLEIVLYILAQTRGTGRIMAGELDGAPWDEWEDAKETYGREYAPLFRITIANGVNRNEKQVARELRKLIAAGIVVEHTRGWKGVRALLSLDLDTGHWHPERLRSGAARLPKPNDAGADRLPNMEASGDGGTTCGSGSAPTVGSGSAPEIARCGSGSAPRFKRQGDVKREGSLSETPQSHHDCGASVPADKGSEELSPLQRHAAAALSRRVKE